MSWLKKLFIDRWYVLLCTFLFVGVMAALDVWRSFYVCLCSQREWSDVVRGLACLAPAVLMPIVGDIIVSWLYEKEIPRKRFWVFVILFVYVFLLVVTGGNPKVMAWFSVAGVISAWIMNWDEPKYANFMSQDDPVKPSRKTKFERPKKRAPVKYK